MKKFLLLGTIFVATSALAFSGLVGGGSSSSKKTTYSGGVDAIGVHFNGKPADSDEADTCPAEKQCGNDCCQMDNICHQDPDSGEYQCCNADLTQCCAVGQGAYSYEDWSMGYPPQPMTACCDGQLYCEQDAEGNCINTPKCCPKERKVHGPLEAMNGNKLYTCCNESQKPYCQYRSPSSTGYGCCDGTVYEGIKLDGSDLCCQPEEIIIKIQEGNPHCCPAGSTGWSENDGCCESGTLPTEDPDGYTHCCPAGSTGWSENDGCCESGTVLSDSPNGLHCCPNDSPGYSDFEGRCCDSGTQVIKATDEQNYCCPENSTGVASYNGDCCGGEISNMVEDSDGATHCCPTGSTGFDLDAGECI